METRCRSAIDGALASRQGRSGHFDLHQGNPAPRFVHCLGLDSWRSSRRHRPQEINIMLGPQVAAFATPVVEFDAALIRRLSQSGPRYTSYPTADRFSESFDYGDYLQAVAGVRNRGGLHPLSLYLHIPFCDSICYYCACNKIVTRRHEKAATYLGYLKREIELQGQLFAGINHVEQLHLGGGTPTYLSNEQMADLMAHLRRCFQFAPDAVGEYSIEVDPRTVSVERV